MSFILMNPELVNCDVTDSIPNRNEKGYIIDPIHLKMLRRISNPHNFRQLHEQDVMSTGNINSISIEPTLPFDASFSLTVSGLRQRITDFVQEPSRIVSFIPEISLSDTGHYQFADLDSLLPFQEEGAFNVITLDFTRPLTNGETHEKLILRPGGIHSYTKTTHILPRGRRPESIAQVIFSGSRMEIEQSKTINGQEVDILEPVTLEQVSLDINLLIQGLYQSLFPDEPLV